MRGVTSENIVLVVLVGLGSHADEAGESLRHHKLVHQVLIILSQGRQKKEKKKKEKKRKKREKNASVTPEGTHDDSAQQHCIFSMVVPPA